MVAASGEKLHIYLDTGGNNFLFLDVVERLGLPKLGLGEGRAQRVEAPFPELAAGSTMPRPQTREGRVIVQKSPPPGSGAEGWSGMLGPEWFAGGCWDFDYPKKVLTLLADCGARFESGPGQVPLGFQEGFYFPRVEVEIDGAPLDLLLDTGANTKLSEAAVSALADGRGVVRATSFITDQTFSAWQSKHPEWRVIEAAEGRTGEAMIEVPAVKFGGQVVGPVWFTRRPTAAFHEFMSEWMDRRIEGALGGNALRDLDMVIDYPGKRAMFRRPPPKL